MESTRLENSFADQLRIEGINFKGYGIIPKYVMIDTDLTIDAKGIYAYFCSFSGNGNAAFPTRDKILRDLKISKDTYYKHFRQLVDQGYIVVQQQLGEHATFARNIYTLVSNPKKFQVHVEESEKNSKVMFERIGFTGLKSFGYGMIPKAVMVDPRLPLRAKGLYAYFCSYTGAGNNAFPRFHQIIQQIRINKEGYYKYFNLLQELNYLTVVQRRVDGKMGINDYYLNDAPDPNKIKPFLEKSDTDDYANGPFPEKQDTESVVVSPFPEKLDTDGNDNVQHKERTNMGKRETSPFLEKSDTENVIAVPLLEKPDTEKQDTEKSDTEKQDININNYKSNNINNITHSFSRHQEYQKKEREREEEIIEEIFENHGIPFTYKEDEEKMTVAIHLATEWKTFYPNGYKDQLRQSVYNLFNEALIQMCMADQLTLKGSCVTYAKVIQRLNTFMKLESGMLDITEISEVAIENYYKAASTVEINHPIRYMQSCIWDAFLTGNIGMYSSLKRELGI